MEAVEMLVEEINKLWLERDELVDKHYKDGGNDPRDIEDRYDFAIITLRKIAIKLEG